MPVHIYVSRPLYKLDYKLELGHSTLFLGKTFYVVSTSMFLHKPCYNFRLTCIYVCQHLWCRYVYHLHLISLVDCSNQLCMPALLHFGMESSPSVYLVCLSLLRCVTQTQF